MFCREIVSVSMILQLVARISSRAGESYLERHCLLLNDSAIYIYIWCNNMYIYSLHIYTHIVFSHIRDAQHWLVNWYNMTLYFSVLCCVLLAYWRISRPPRNPGTTRTTRKIPPHRGHNDKFWRWNLDTFFRVEMQLITVFGMWKWWFLIRMYVHIYT